MNEDYGFSSGASGLVADITLGNGECCSTYFLPQMHLHTTETFKRPLQTLGDARDSWSESRDQDKLRSRSCRGQGSAVVPALQPKESTISPVTCNWKTVFKKRASSEVTPWQNNKLFLYATDLLNCLISWSLKCQLWRQKSWSVNSGHERQVKPFPAGRIQNKAESLLFGARENLKEVSTYLEAYCSFASWWVKRKERGEKEWLEHK